MATWSELNKGAGGTATASASGWNAINAAAKAIPVVSAPSSVSIPSPFSTGLPKPADTGFNYGGATPFMEQGAAGPSEQIGQGVSQLQSPSILQKIYGGLNVAGGVIGAASVPFTPISALISKAVDYVGGKLSDLPTIKSLANNSSPEQQKSDTDALTAFANLGTIAMAAMGLKGGEADAVRISPEKLAEVSQHPAVIEAAQKLADTQKPATSWDSLNTSAKISHADYAKSQGYEPVVPDNELPVIQAGPKSQSTLPTIQTEVPNELPAPAGMKVEPIKSPIQVSPSAGETKLQIAPSEASTPSSTGRTSQILKPVEGTGELKTRGLSQNVEATAIEKKIADNFGDLPSYKTISMKDQALQAADLIIKDFDTAKEIALGNKTPPKGLLPESVFVAVEHDATINGDVQTLKDLANSKLSSSATTMGQRIRTLGERDSASPLAAIQEVQKAREEALATRGATIKQETVTRIKESIKKVNTKENWSSFIESIQC